MDANGQPSQATPGTVIVVGGGFGGLYTALAIAQERHHPPVLLVEPREHFLFLPLLYELLSGELRSWEIAPRYDKVLAGHGVGWLQDRVERIDLATRTLQTAAGRSLHWERLVLATGASTDSFGVPGADRHTLSFRSLSDVQRLQQLLTQLAQAGRPLQRLAVVGGGPTGVELACKLADLAGATAVVELIEQGETLLPQSHAFNREQAGLSLQRRDVRVRTRTRVVEVGTDRLVLQRLPEAEEEVLTVQGVVWTAGQRCRPPLITPSPETDRIGRLVCGPELRLRGRDDVFVVGDLAAVPQALPADGSLPTTAQVAFQQAPVVAANLLRSLRGDPLQPFQWKDLGEMISLGKGEAALTSGGITLAGPAAFQLRRLAYLTRLPGLPHQLRVAAGWLADWPP
jgi:demethylphylloquinone reductase